MTRLVDVPLTADLLRGAVEIERSERGLRPHRLPAWARQQLPDPRLMTAEQQPSGVRVAFRSRATRVELEVLASRVSYRGVDRPRGRLDLALDGEVVRQVALRGGDAVVLDLATGEREQRSDGPDVVVVDDLPATDKLVEVWLPHDEAVDLLALRADADVRPAPPRGRTWVHHGSSISQGSNALGPSGTWPAVAARLTGAELVNLGFGGSALLDASTARTIRDLPADVVSVEVGINIVNTDAMRLRALTPALHGFLDTIREGHPDVPLLVVSPLLCPIHEDTPGPSAVDPASLVAGAPRFVATGTRGDTGGGRLTLQVVRDEVARLVDQRRAGDPQLVLLDGLALYGPQDTAAHPLPDGLHPDPRTHQLIGQRFAAATSSPGGPLAAPPSLAAPGA